MKTILIQAWTIHKSKDIYYLPYTHWVYLNEIVNYYDEVTLLCPVIKHNDFSIHGLVSLSPFDNVNIVALPPFNNYIVAIRHFFSYYKTYSALPKYDVVYARYPTPFGWLQKIFFKKARRIIHYVGDPVDAARNNPNFSSLKKKLYITLFKPENAMYNWACKGASVFTNGHHIAERLKKNHIIAKPLISSTLNENDFYFEANKSFNKNKPRLLYVGYLRKAKGVETIIKAFNLLQSKYPNAELTIVGTGEFEKELKELVQTEKMNFVSFLGHVDDRAQLNDIIRNHDYFCFGSLSEGSPRVILEAMANGINVISTPVGSLPTVFVDDQDITFARFNDENDFFNKIDSLLTDSIKSNLIRENAFKKVKNFTIKNFIKEIFYEA